MREALDEFLRESVYNGGSIGVQNFRNPAQDDIDVLFEFSKRHGAGPVSFVSLGLTRLACYGNILMLSCTNVFYDDRSTLKSGEERFYFINGALGIY